MENLVQLTDKIFKVYCSICNKNINWHSAFYLNNKCWECHKKTSVCNKCPKKDTCEWAFDPYNDEDSCLCEK